MYTAEQEKLIFLKSEVRRVKAYKENEKIVFEEVLTQNYFDNNKNECDLYDIFGILTGYVTGSSKNTKVNDFTNNRFYNASGFFINEDKLAKNKSYTGLHHFIDCFGLQANSILQACYKYKNLINLYNL